VLVVEIVSPSNTQANIDEKLDAYLDARIPLIWIAHPRRHTVTVYRPDAEPVMFNATADLTAEPHLPGFRVRVKDLFE
jgi:Uma2 family endonuclease